ncbi:MAG: hypothetical protein JWP69_678 [Flaviaesturariibacter sp.]|nr:hypothetical protein [Flaviaesturariibacter sp.]
MKKNIYNLFFLLLVLITIGSCSDKEYVMGDVSAPTDLVINTEIVGIDATHPNGDGSGNVNITLSAKNALSYKIDFDASDAVDLVYLPNGKVTKKYTKLGLNTYRITAIAYGKGGTSTTVTKEISVRSDFTVAPAIETSLTGGASKTWKVEKDVPGHFGVGPWTGSSTPEWWAAPPRDKEACCNCFYTARFTFTKVTASNTYTLQVATPDGAFTKTGALTTLPGIPGSGAEGCYSYGGGTSGFTFIPSSTSVPASASTKTSILLGGNNTFIGYGALMKEYEILSISPTNLYLRIQGTETGNAWYLKLIPQ